MIPHPLLHVVYASRGDCFILEYGPENGRKFILIDGGTRMPAAFRFNVTAPYHRYLSSAIRAISQPHNTSNRHYLNAFAGVIISHADEDHYGGYVCALQRSEIKMDVPAYTPQSTSSVMEECSAYNKVFANSQLDRTYGTLQHDSNRPDSVYDIEPFVTIFPPALRYYSRQDDDRIATTNQYNKGLYSKNGKSILMYTNVTGTREEMGMFFTGDNDANTINTYMINHFTTYHQQPVPRFSIYKIQHHGSIKDSHLGDYPVDFSDIVKNEAALYALYQIVEGRRCLPPLLEDDSAVLAAADTLRDLLSNTNPQQEKEFYEGLEKRVQSYQHQLSDLVPPAENHHWIITEVAPLLDPPASDRLKSILDHVSVNFFMQGNVLKGWNRFNNNLAIGWDLRLYLTIRNIKNFYASFQSDVYVVSAFPVHTSIHPSPETLLGLALALKENGRKARLYVTSGISINVIRLSQLVNMVNQGSMEELFGNNFEIFYLAYGAFLTLSGQSQGIHSNEVICEREVAPVSKARQVDFVNDTAQERAALSTQMERGPSAVLYTRLSIFCGDRQQFMHIQGGQPALTADEHAAVWVDAREDAPNGPTNLHQAKTFRCRDGKLGLARSFHYLKFIRAGYLDGDPQQPQYYIRSTGAEKSFFVDGRGQIVFRMVQPLGSTELKFQVTETQEEEPEATEGIYGIEAVRNEVTTARDDRRKILPKPNHARPGGITPTFSETTRMKVLEFIRNQRIHTLTGNMTFSQVLSCLVGEMNFKAVFQDAKKEVISFLRNMVHFGKSTVDVVASTSGTSIVAASLKLVDDGANPPTIDLGGKLHKILEGNVSLQWERNESLAITYTILTQDQLKMSHKHGTTRAKQPQVPLILALEQAGIRLNGGPKTSLPYLMSQILGNTSRARKKLVEQLPAILVKHGFALVKPELNKSTGKIVRSADFPFAGAWFEEAMIVCTVGTDTPTISLAKSIQIAGFTFEFKDVRIALKNGGLSNESITIEGGATLSAAGTGLELTMSCVLQDHCTLDFCAKSGSIKELVGALSKTDMDDILKISIPAQKEGETSTMVSKGDAELHHHKVGFVLSQPVNGIASYQVAKVYVETSFSDWKELLPDETKARFEKVDATARFEVWDPLHRETRRGAVCVKFDIAGPDELQQTLHVEFSVYPLAYKGDYQNSLRITTADSNGMKIPHIIQAVGLHDVSEEIGRGLPMLEGVLEKVFIRELAVSVEKRASKLVCADWTIDLHVSSLEIIPERFLVQEVDLRVHKLPDDELQASGKARFESTKYNKSCTLELTLPDQTNPGSIKVESPGGLSLANIFEIFQLGDVQEIPVLKEISSIELLFCEFNFNYTEARTKQKKIQILGLETQLRKKDLSIATLKLEDLWFSIKWQRIDKNHSRKSAIDFSFSARLAGDAPVYVKFNYNGDNGIFSAKLVTDARKPVKISNVLPHLWPSIDNELHSLLGDLIMKSVSVEFSLDAKAVKSFTLDLSNDATLDITKGQSQSPLSLKSLSFEYHKLHLKKKTTSSKGKHELHTTAELQASVSICNISMRIKLSYQQEGEAKSMKFSITPPEDKEKSLSLTALLSDLAIGHLDYPKPDENLKFDAGLRDINGEFQFDNKEMKTAKSPKSKLTLTQLSLRVETAQKFTIFDVPEVAIESLYLMVNYRASKLSGVVWGSFSLAKDHVVTLKYTKDANGKSDFSGRYSLATETKKTADAVKEVGVETVLERFLSHDDQKIPAMQNRPSRLLVDEIDFFFKPNESFFLLARGATLQPGTRPVEVECSGIKVQFENIGVRLTVTKSSKEKAVAQRKPYEYEVFLCGKIAIPGFVSTTAMVDIKGKRCIMVATLECLKGNGTDISVLANQVSQPSGSWIDLVGNPASLHFKTGAQMYLDAEKGMFFICGDIDGHGSALFLAKKTNDLGYSYYFSLEASHVEKIWQGRDLEENVTRSFQIKKVIIRAVTRDTTVEELQKDLDTCREAITRKSSIDDVNKGLDATVKRNPPTTEPPSTAKPVEELPLAILHSTPVNPQGHTLNRGVCFVADIGLGGSGEMTEALSLASQGQPEKNQRATITLYARLNSQRPEYKLFVRDLFLEGGTIRIGGSADYYPKFKDSTTGVVQQRKLVLKANVVMTSEDLQEPLTLGAIITFQKDRTVIQAGASLGRVSNPFKTMFGVHLDSLQISGHIQGRGNNHFSISGNASLGSLPSDKSRAGKLATMIYFQKAIPTTVVVEYGRQSAGQYPTGQDIFSQLIDPPKPGAVAETHWSNEHLPTVIFRNAYIYYSSVPFKEAEGTRSYKSGFWIGAVIDILGKDFEVQAHLEKKGLLINGSRNGPMDLDFVKFTGVLQKKDGVGELERTAGPALEIKVKEKVNEFKITAGVIFLDTILPDIEFRYSNKAIETKITFGHDLGPFQNSGFTIVWSNGHFSFKNWKLENMDIDGFDLNNAIKMAPPRSLDCPYVGEDVLDKIVQTKFSFDIRFPQDKKRILDERGLHLVIVISYEIKVPGKDFGPLSLNPGGGLDITIPKPFKPSSALGALSSVVTENTAKLGSLVADNVELFAALLAEKAVVEFGSETLRAILCRGLKDPKFWNRVKDWILKRFEALMARIRELLKLFQALFRTTGFLSRLTLLAQIIPEVVAILPEILVVLAIILVLKDAFPEKDNPQTSNTLKNCEKNLQDHKLIIEKNQDDAYKGASEILALEGVFQAHFANGNPEKVVVTWENLEIQKSSWSIACSTFETFLDAKERPMDFSSKQHVEESSEYRYCPTVFVRVTATLTVEYKVGKESKTQEVKLTPRASAQHVPFLRPPKGLRLSIKDDPRYVTIDFDLDQGIYELVIRSVHSEDQYPLYHTTMKILPNSPKTRAIELISKREEDFHGLNGLVVTQIRQLSDNTALFEHSPWLKASESITAKKYLTNIKTRMWNRQIAVSWADCNYKRFCVNIYKGDKEVSRTSFSSLKSPHAFVDLPKDVEEEEVLSVTVSPIDIPKNICSLYSVSLVVVFYLPIFTVIDDGTEFLFEAKELKLKLHYDFGLGSHEQLILQCNGSDGSRKTMDLTVPKKPGDAYVTVKPLKEPYPKSLTLISKSDKHKSEGPLWKLPKIPKILPIIEDRKAVVENGNLIVSFKAPANVTSVRVEAIAGLRTSFAEVLAPSEVWGMASLKDLPVYSEAGTKFLIKLTSKHGPQVSGPTTTFYYTSHPGFTYWTNSKVFRNEPLTINSGLTIAVRDKEPTLFFWTHEGIETRLLACREVQPHIEVVQSFKNTYKNDEGFSLASISINESHLEVYWAGEDGLVHGGLKDRDHNNVTPCPWPRGGYRFKDYRGAESANGGSIVAAGDRPSKSLHLWWVGTDWNQQRLGYVKVLKYANCKPDIWWSEDQNFLQNQQALYSDTECISSLAAVISPGGYATAYFITEGRELVSYTQRNEQIPTSRVNYNLNRLKNEESIAVKSGICAIPVDKDSIRVFWITNNGAVLGAMDYVFEMCGGDFETAPREKVQISPPGSASTRSEIAAFHRITSEGTTDLRLWWFAEDGRLMGARVRYNWLDGVAGEVYEQAPAGLGRKSGRMIVRVSKTAQKPLRIWYVDSENRVRYQDPFQEF